ncbi:MAG TPA: hypothetical protein PKN75_14385 [Bacteroidia bacterium]|nr:hypothetical protein [Bacteroidia bacterium]HNU34772.1 hypothetical protein [Bacteroidia bacterium]
MIPKKIKQLIADFRVREQFIEAQSRELEWAHIFHDSIRGRHWLEELQLSPGRWAGNYSLLYLLVRILADYKPKTILEFGLGESSKVISAFLKNELHSSHHTIVEHSKDWIATFENRFSLASNSQIAIHDSIASTVYEIPTNTYSNLQAYKNSIMDFYLVDGISSDRFSRNYIVQFFENAQSRDEFIVIIDDYLRPGEVETSNDLIGLLNNKGIKTYTGEYIGNKSQIVIATEKYKYATSL